MNGIMQYINAKTWDIPMLNQLLLSLRTSGNSFVVKMHRMTHVTYYLHNRSHICKSKGMPLKVRLRIYLRVILSSLYTSRNTDNIDINKT